MHRSRAARRVLACGVRLGKSTIGVYECVAALLEPREQARGWLVAPTLDLTNRIARHVVELMQQHFTHRIVKFDPRERSIKVVNLGGGMSELRAKSTDSPVSLLGESLDFLVVDEAAKVRDDVWNDYLSPRLLDRRGWALLLSTPAGPGWFYDLYRRGRRGKDAGFEAWSMPTSANPHVPMDGIEAERERIPPDVYREQYLGEFVGVELVPCDTCGGPSSNCPTAVVLRGKEEPRLCPECEGIVGEDGSTRVGLDAKGKPYTIVVTLQPPISRDRVWPRPAGSQIPA